MADRILPYFDAIQNGFLFRVYITSSELLCVRLGKGPAPRPPSPGATKMAAAIGIAISLLLSLSVPFIVGFMIGWDALRTTRGLAGVGAPILAILVIGSLLGAGVGKFRSLSQTGVIDEVSRFEAGVNEELTVLAKYDQRSIRTYIKEKKRGFVLDPERLAEARIDHVGKWKRWFFGTPVLALIVQHPTLGGTGVFEFRKKIDVVTGICELEQLLGDQLDLAANTDEHEKAIRKYKKSRASV